jgi:YegS/Rv2252/BmrU family lipid kinase
VTAVIFNPTARGEKATAFQSRLSSLAGPLRLLPTRGPGDASTLAAEAAAEGIDTIVAAGGDGTVNEVANGLAAADRFPIRPRLGVIPLGTVNVFAKELRLPADLGAAWECIRAGRVRRIDLASATHAGGKRWFVQMAGAGLDAEAIARVDWGLKKKIGPLAYVWAGFQALRGPLATIRVTGGPEPLDGQLALVGNGRFYGGRYPMFPNADLGDGLLDLALFGRANLLTVARAAVALATGRLLHLSGIRHQQAPSFRFETDGTTPFEVEGDNVGGLPVEFRIQPRALDVIVPE